MVHLLHCPSVPATIKAIHTGPNASKTSSDDASGLEPVICLSRGAKVMLTSNLLHIYIHLCAHIDFLMNKNTFQTLVNGEWMCMHDLN